MGAVCLCYSWTCRPLWPLFIILSSVFCMLHCTENPAAVVGKMYPRGNHWAVGHLMGKKSLSELDHDRDQYLTPTDTDLIQNLMEAFLQPKKQKMAPSPNRVQRSWREEDRETLRETYKLLLLALKLQENDST